VLSGFIVIDKPAGVTSHDVVAMLRRLFHQKKIGHTGTLDPFATGVLPVALGEATKAIPFLDESEKEYFAVMRLGVSTDTQDLTGRIVSERSFQHVTSESIRSLIPHFTGSLTQVPPMFSALKRDGVPLYRLARRGESVEREERRIEISSLTIDQVELPDVAFKVRCSRGTYVRTLANDMGDFLGCGAHLQELRRTKSGPFTIEAAVTIDRLCDDFEKGGSEDFLVSIQSALGMFPEMRLTGSGCSGVSHGAAPGLAELEGEFAVSPGERVRLSCRGDVKAIGEGLPLEERINGKFLRLIRVFNLLCPLHGGQ
jgi:tRNA pseudouridine55 synthase